MQKVNICGMVRTLLLLRAHFELWISPVFERLIEAGLRQTVELIIESA